MNVSTSSLDAPYASLKSISALPPEILLNIFEEVYLASCDLDVDTPDDLTDLRLFPRCITGVCKAWKKLIKSVPHFATQIMIFVDEPVSPSDLAAEFKISKSLLIKVFVIRRDYSPAEDMLEKRRVKGVMQVLARHITRCKVVVFDLLHNSSLPRITDFSGSACKLRTLRVKCRLPGLVDDHVQPTPSLAREPDAFLCPSLQYLDLDGRVFIAAMRIPGWDESIRLLTQKRLSITNITYSEGQDFDLHKFLVALSKLGHLTTLELSNVDLDSWSCIGRESPSIFIQNFEFEGLNGDFITGFFAHHHNRIEVSNISFTNCQLGPTEYLHCWRLNLQRILPGEDITEFVKDWDGFGLHIQDCPGLDDRLLELLSNFQASKEALFAPTLRELHISSSGSLSVQAVKNLVFIRGIEAEMHDPELDGGQCLPMYSISVADSGPSPSPEDRQWLEEKLERFWWYTTPASCESPILDCDCSQWDFSEFNDPELEGPDTQSQQPPPPDSPILSQDYSLIEWSPEDKFLNTYLAVLGQCGKPDAAQLPFRLNRPQRSPTTFPLQGLVVHV
ncbi:hypothetical protein GALMADRAFT_246657 [Galerina marginata CBS 339.88]|uniref:F-box domain-containing protein n=1 Tax=Galerina marginata (strain CBS 339.88) TaxID=685588 RepID=A0A067T4N0_GALM3|nr:hypothetical protein GALMADRAFT_246657 [Galerina marginata CBS 339.88]